MPQITNQIFNNLRDKLLKVPIKAAIKESINDVKNDLAFLLQNIENRLTRNLNDQNTALIASSILSGLTSGGIGAAGGLLGALGASIYNSYSQEKHNKDLAYELLSGGEGPYQIKKLLEEELKRKTLNYRS